MAVNFSIYVKSFTFGGQTYDNTTGGPISARYQHMGRVLEDRTGDDWYPRFAPVVDPSCRVSISVRNVKWTIAPGTKSNLVLTIEGKSGSTYTLTFADMVFEGVSGSQDRASPGSAELSFVYESDDGATAPLS
ncbi:MAG: hypothetical protein N3A66_08545 [Planctomycetota bacterium]|nr:hypothetical protein [Planctomycetota bacterium]